MARVINKGVLRRKETEGAHTENRKETSEISWTYNEKEGLVEFDRHRAYRR